MGAVETRFFHAPLLHGEEARPLSTAEARSRLRQSVGVMGEVVAVSTNSMNENIDIIVNVTCEGGRRFQLGLPGACVTMTEIQPAIPAPLRAYGAQHFHERSRPFVLGYLPA